MTRIKKKLLWLSIVISSLLCSIQGYSEITTEDKWDELLKREPFIYTIPAVTKKTVIDGVYVKSALRKGEIVPCRRCPDWFANPGIWRIDFKEGVYRVINTNTGWKSIGTYVVSEDRILLANDPVCIYDFGLYAFQKENGRLSLKVIDDPCGIKLRGLNLSETEWMSCMPPNQDAAVTGHWPKPQGCR